MREIEFRGKRVDNGEWEYGYYAKTPLTNEFFCLGDCRTYDLIIVDGTYYHIDPDTVGQYTGAKDRNGKEIYEGDILSYDNGLVLAKVFWDDKTSGFALEFIWHGKHKTTENIRMALVMARVGNIHDDPELLESEV